MTINGTLFDNYYNPFIINNGVDECQITGFIFTGFRSPILCLRGIKKVYVSDCYFYNNSITKNMGLLIITFSTCKFSRCIFCQNSIHETSIISILTSFCILEFCNISFNSVSHSSKQGLLFSSNSNCDFVNVTIDFNEINNSIPLFQFEWRSYIAFYNSTFAHNYYNCYEGQKSLINSDGICEISMYQSNVINNSCSILISKTENSIIIMNTVNISFNQAGLFPLFDIPGGSFTFPMTSIIEHNSFLTFADFHNLKSDLTLVHAHFTDNNSTNSFIKMNNESSINLEYSSFKDNYFLNGIIDANNVRINSHNNGFINNNGLCIKCKNCSTKINSDIYISNANTSILHLTSNSSSMTVIFGSYFSNNLMSYCNQILLEGKSFLLLLRFNTSNKKLFPSCFLCYYNQKTPGVFTLYSVLLTYLLTLILIFFIFKYSNRYLTKLYFLHYKVD